MKTNGSTLFSFGVLLAMLLFLLATVAGCGLCLPGDNEDGESGNASITFISVPPLGSFGDLVGRTTCVDPSTHRVVVYIRVNGVYWVKPFADSPLTPIVFGLWSTDITTGGIDEQATEIRAFVVRADYDAGLHALPEIGEFIASTSVER